MENFGNLRARPLNLVAKYEVSKESKFAQIENTSHGNRHIASLAVWPFYDAQFSTFWDVNSLQDDATETKPVFGYVSVSQKGAFG